MVQCGVIWFSEGVISFSLCDMVQCGVGYGSVWLGYDSVWV